MVEAGDRERGVVLGEWGSRGCSDVIVEGVSDVVAEGLVTS